MLTGIDYSAASIELARGVERARKLHGPPSDSDSDSEDQESVAHTADNTSVDWRVADLLRQDFMSETWDLVMDKGTYDALALSDESVEEAGGRKPSAVYPEKVAKLVTNEGYFLITCKLGRCLDVEMGWDCLSCLRPACNFTEAEIMTRFGRPELGLVYQ
jgi:EEF1A lysine methyltransferase 2